MTYPEKLKQNDFENIETAASSFLIPKSSISFKNWTEEPLNNTFGGKPLIELNEEPMFAELAIMNTFINAGWEARWIETYGKAKMSPVYITEWIDINYKAQIHRPINHQMVNILLQAVAQNNNNNFAGCWDVLAWKGDKVIFAESKRSKRDRIKETQKQWLEAALKTGFTTENFLMVEWSFDEERK